MNKIITILLMGLLPLLFSAGVSHNPYNYDTIELKRRIAILESNGNWRAVNVKSGALGKYQFLPSTLESMRKRRLIDTTEKNLCKMNFLADTVLQEAYMDKLLSMNLDKIKKNRYGELVGQEIDGVTVTLEGMLAASHLLGFYSVDWYVSCLKDINPGLRNRFDKYPDRVLMEDGMGTPITKYLRIMELNL